MGKSQTNLNSRSHDTHVINEKFNNLFDEPIAVKFKNCWWSGLMLRSQQQRESCNSYFEVCTQKTVFLSTVNCKITFL